MKRIYVYILLISIFYGCKSVVKRDLLPYVIGVDENYREKIISTDSISILSPAVEIYETDSNFNSETDYVSRDEIKGFIVKLLKSELNKEKHFELELMSKDYGSINSVVEMLFYEKTKSEKDLS